MKRAAALVTVFATVACGDLLPPKLTGEAISPDGQLVARSWCREACDMPEARTITVSSVARPLKPDTLPSGDHVVAKVYFDTDNVELRWTGNRHLTIAGKCLTDSELQPLSPQKVNGLRLHFVRLPTHQRCWQEAVQQGRAS